MIQPPPLAPASARPLLAEQAPEGRLASLEVVKAFALLWICLVHWTERVFGSWYIANPANDWPPLAERIAQLTPLSGSGFWDIPLTLLLGFARAGDQGVQLFLIVSGFGLTWAMLRSKTGSPEWLAFYRRRLSRIYPEYWVAHLLVLSAAFLAGRILLSDTSFLLSMLGIRVTPDLLYKYSPSWWYIGLILQIYLVYPLLGRLLQRLGWVRFLIATAGVALIIRTIGLWVFADLVPEWGYLDAWARGAIFITRLPEFAFGMALAAWAHQSPDRVAAGLQSGLTLTLAAIGYVVAIVLSAFLLGNGVAIFMLGAGVFILLYALFDNTVVRWRAPMRVARWLSEHTYSLFLIHFAVLAAVIPDRPPVNATLALRTGVFIIGALAVALLLEFLTARGRALANMIRGLPARRRWQVAGGCAAVWLLLVGAELWVRAYDPQEVNGWGERPSLEEDSIFGWRLIPDKTTRLRWLGYDYQVSANALGFPGRLYPAQRAPGVPRVMTTGDAFTSAEGVDTPQAWPRVLESALAGRLTGRPVEVLNFGVTGYGPNQHAAIAEAFVPAFKPDVLVLTMFVNEFDDAALADERFRQSIGFAKTPADGLYAVLTLGHLSTLAYNEAVKLAFERVLGRPDPAHANFAQLNAFRAGSGPDVAENRAMLRQRLEEMGRITDANAVRLLLLLVPANVQVCGPADLEVYPRNVDLTDKSRYDLERPQRVLSEIASALDIEAVDLRPVLAEAGRCLYQRRNMHWLPEAHQRVATFVADLLASEQQPATTAASARPARRRPAPEQGSR